MHLQEDQAIHVLTELFGCQIIDAFWVEIVRVWALYQRY